MKTEYPYLDRRARWEAKCAGQLRKWGKSVQHDIQCVKSIEEAIGSHCSGGNLESGAAGTVLEQYGLQRVSFVLADLVKWEFGNVSAEVSDWTMSIPVHSGREYISQFSQKPDIRLLDAFIKQVWEARQKLGLYGVEHCIGGWDRVHFQGKTLVMNADCTSQSVTSLKDQLWYAMDGNGCHPDHWGGFIRAVRLDDGKTEMLERGVFAGVLNERYLPDWAAEKLAELQASQKEQPEPSSGGMEMTI